jgi:hypothetical protein
MTKEIRQCPSCGGICKKSGCERENLPRYTVGLHRVDYADFEKALELACYFQNRCCDLEEIVELFCLDAEQMYQQPTAAPPFVLPYPVPHPTKNG